MSAPPSHGRGDPLNNSLIKYPIRALGLLIRLGVFLGLKKCLILDHTCKLPDEQIEFFPLARLHAGVQVCGFAFARALCGTQRRFDDRRCHGILSVWCAILVDLWLEKVERRSLSLIGIILTYAEEVMISVLPRFGPILVDAPRPKLARSHNNTIIGDLGKVS